MLAQNFHSFTTNAMGATAVVALHAAILCFMVAALMAVAALFQPRRMRMLWAECVGGAGAAALGTYFIARFSEAGTEPFSNLFEVINLAALCVALTCFAIARVRKLKTLAAFAFPGIAVIFVVNLLFADSAAQGRASSGLLVVHVVLTLMSYGLFFMAAIAAVMFLLQERALKKHRDPAVIRDFPPLESLRRLVNTCILTGLPLLTLGLGLGFVAMSDQGWEAILRNPKIPPSVVLWGVLLLAAAGRWTGRLHGRRHLYMVLAGFALVLMTFVGLGVWSRSQATAPQQQEVR
ncbi:MAG: cytochrome c biogenesis protein CcsA [Planctomycetes bacterium]|nr:cytochrome c biogenesis protein CcsA [Planctomycetota bacterium]MCW8134743.1 cytochrome c biogenesis protein CcsA [Planctomycetota bacterium]